ncbi:MAG: hypothetical protein KC496_03915, partial [Anaerolineae bacterium]|nr:hypothetical protein [Anaerolineae bacterium]
EQVLGYMVRHAFLNLCNHIWIEIHENNFISCQDDGIGLPIERIEGTNFSVMEAFIGRTFLDRSICETLLEPQPFWSNGRMVGGGVWIGIVPPLCEQFTFETFRNGAWWRQSYSEGLPTSELVGIRDARAETGRGTTFTFRPDFSIFEQNDFDFDSITARAQEVAALIAGLTIEVRDLRTNPVREAKFHYAEGLKSRVEELNADAKPLHDVVHLHETVTMPRKYGDDWMIQVEIAFQFTEGETTDVRGYANTVFSRAGGTHIMALKTGLLACLNESQQTADYGQDHDLTWEELSQGLTAMVSVYHPQPLYLDTVEVRIHNPEIFGQIAGMVYTSFNQRSGDNYFVLQRIIEHHLARR